jgi:hypothetical protein
MPHFAKMEKITLAYELSRANLEAPPNWVFVNATNILEKNLPFLDKIQLDHMYPNNRGRGGGSFVRGLQPRVEKKL